MVDSVQDKMIPIPYAPPRLKSETTDPRLFINRELSWLEFNQRVLDEANDPTVPLLERLRFLAITASNLDEFFEVRVAGLRAQTDEGLDPQDPPPDGMTALTQLIEIANRVDQLVENQYQTWFEDLAPSLSSAGIVVVSPGELTAGDRQFVTEFYESEVYPVLTPLAIDPSHPFPHIHNKSLNLILRLERDRRNGMRDDSPRQLFAVLQVPSVLNRLVALPEVEDTRHRFVLLEDVIGLHLDGLFGGFQVRAQAPFRVTRNWDISAPGEEAGSSWPTVIREKLRERMRGTPVRLEISDRAEDSLVTLLKNPSVLNLDDRDVYRVSGPVSLASLAGLCKIDGFRELKEPAWKPRYPAFVAEHSTIFDAIRARDLLVHHPFDSFEVVTQFLTQAAEDPNVMAIKQTLYRISDDNPMIDALATAAGNGKNVTAVVELTARLEEKNNLMKGEMLREAGVHVVYGLFGMVEFKTHCKTALVVRRDPDRIRNYLHLGTGNYNPITAKLYTDLGLFTCRPDYGEDALALFNLLTVYSTGHLWNKLLLAPDHMVNRVLEMIDRERLHAEEGRPARIVAKMNSLVDPRAIQALYGASEAGVQIDLIVRGICCLKPGLDGVSKNIRVISVIDKFLEHSRITAFANGGHPEIYLSSADWMPRNFNRRVELMFPIEDPKLHNRIVFEILAAYLSDNCKSRRMRPNGDYERLTPGPGEPSYRSQLLLQEDYLDFEFPSHTREIVDDLAWPAESSSAQVRSLKER